MGEHLQLHVGLAGERRSRVLLLLRDRGRVEVRRGGSRTVARVATHRRLRHVAHLRGRVGRRGRVAHRRGRVRRRGRVPLCANAVLREKNPSEQPHNSFASASEFVRLLYPLHCKSARGAVGGAVRAVGRRGRVGRRRNRSAHWKIRSDLESHRSSSKIKSPVQIEDSTHAHFQPDPLSYESSRMRIRIPTACLEPLTTCCGEEIARITIWPLLFTCQLEVQWHRVSSLVRTSFAPLIHVRHVSSPRPSTHATYRTAKIPFRAPNSTTRHPL